VQPSWSESDTTRHNFGRGPSNDYFIKVWYQLSNWFQTRRFLWEFPIGSYVPQKSLGQCNQTLVEWSFDGPLTKLCPVIPTSNQDGRQAKNRKKGLWEFPIGSYVKLSSAVVAISVGGLKCRPHFWKGTTQGSFQQSLVPLPKLCLAISLSDQDGCTDELSLT
jgi:hypothetical protein